jgi:hypothetical protein
LRSLVAATLVAAAACSSPAGSSSPGTGGASGSSGGGTTGTAGGGGTGTACTPLAPITRRLWRLSVEQWGNAVRDLLGLQAAPVLTSRGGEADYAFFSDVTLQVDADMQFALYQAADAAVTGLSAAQVGTLAPCSGTTATAQTACAMTFAQSFAPKAFRRPVDSTEITNLMNVYTQAAMQDYPTGIRMMIEALLISPSFVYRTELGPSTLTADATGKYPDTTLTPYEIASQLGFMFLGSVPDAALTAAAADGSLATPDGLTAQVNRLLALPATQGNLTGIMIDWFNVRQMFDKTKDTSLLAALATADQDQAALTSDLYTSTQQLFSSILWQGTGKLDDLLTTQQVVVNKRLATLYPGLTFTGTAPSDNSTFVTATWPAGQARSGVLTQPSYLWSQSDPSLTSIVKRGKAIHDDVLCQDPLGSPVDLTTPSAMNVIGCKSPDGTMTLSACDSEILKSDARLMYQPCKACHSQMDPYARVLQNFGPIGNYRTMDEAGRPIDPTVTFVPNSPLAPQTLSGAPAFAQAAIASGVFDGCAVQKIASYAIGAMIRTYDTCDVDSIRTQTDGTIASLFRQVALADFLRARAGGVQ